MMSDEIEFSIPGYLCPQKMESAGGVDLVTKSPGNSRGKCLKIAVVSILLGTALIVVATTILWYCFKSQISSYDPVGEIQSSLNTSVDPCDNFYNFACQGWEERNPPPASPVRKGIMRDTMMEGLQLISDLAKKPVSPNDLPALSSAKRYFQKCKETFEHYDEVTHSQDLQYARNKLEEYGGWPILHQNGTWNSSRFDWMKTVAGLSTEFSSVEPFAIFVFPALDGNVSSNFIAICKNPPNLGLADEDAHKSSIPQKRIKEIEQTILALDSNRTVDDNWTKSKIAEIVKFEEDLSSLQKLEPGELPCGFLKHAEHTVETLQAKVDADFNSSTVIDILKLANTFYADTGIEIKKTQLITTPNLKYLVGLSRLIGNNSAETLANYLHHKMAQKMIENLYKDGGNADLKCTMLVGTGFSIALAHGYAKQTFGSQIEESYIPEDYKEIHSMSSNIIQAFLDLIASTKNPEINSSLLSQVVSGVNMCLGFPNWILNDKRVSSVYAGLNLTENFQEYAGLLQQSIMINKWSSKWVLESLRKPQEETKCNKFFWIAGPYYTMQEVYFPPRFLQPPIYHNYLPGFWNYGKLGNIIAHEIAHSYPGLGMSEFANGTKTRSAECLIHQYSEYKLDNTNQNTSVNGLQTLTENLADNAGLLAAYKAYKMSSPLETPHKLKGLDMYTNDQLFFLGFAQTWCTAATNDTKLAYLSVDPHSPAQFRVLGTLKNSEEFAKAWNCPVGSIMNPAYEKKCKLF